MNEHKKIMVGIFSYNEGENLQNMYEQIKKQCTGLQCEIVLIDESNEQESLDIVNKIMGKDKVSYYALPSTLNDYMRGTKRMYSKVKTALMKYPEVCLIEDVHGNRTNVLDLIYSRPPMKVILMGILSDPVASLFVPYVMLIRFVVMKTAGIYTSDTWDAIESTKRLGV